MRMRDGRASTSSFGWAVIVRGESMDLLDLLDTSPQTSPHFRSVWLCHLMGSHILC